MSGCPAWRARWTGERQGRIISRQGHDTERRNRAALNYVNIASNVRFWTNRQFGHPTANADSTSRRAQHPWSPESAVLIWEPSGEWATVCLAFSCSLRDAASAWLRPKPPRKRAARRPPPGSAQETDSPPRSYFALLQTTSEVPPVDAAGTL